MPEQPRKLILKDPPDPALSLYNRVLLSVARHNFMRERYYVPSVSTVMREMIDIRSDMVVVLEYDMIPKGLKDGWHQVILQMGIMTGISSDEGEGEPILPNNISAVMQDVFFLVLQFMERVYGFQGPFKKRA